MQAWIVFHGVLVCRCAGTCQFSSAGGCIIKLSEPILKLRPQKDLKETLLHEMIHAYIFLHNIPGAGRDGHGPPFRARMKRINESTAPDLYRPPEGYNVTVYHTMHQEVDHYRTHWWQCDRCAASGFESLLRKASTGSRDPRRAPPECNILRSQLAVLEPTFILRRTTS